MVRVFSVYQFGGQTIHRIPDDICAACLIDANQLVLAKCNHLIEIVTLRNNVALDDVALSLCGDGDHSMLLNDNEIQTKFTFPTVDEVVEMAYCEFGKFNLIISIPNDNIM